VRRGFTFIELCLGMVMTAIISGAVASFLLSVSACWNATENLHNATIRANQFSERLAGRIRDAKRIGYWKNASAGGAAMIFWRDCDNDGVMVRTELSVVQYAPLTQTIDLYTAPVVNGDVGAEWTPAEFTDPSAIAVFSAGLTPEPMIRNVSAADLGVANATSTDVAPTVSWTLALIDSDGVIVTRQCTAALRGPATPP
jgi:Tfp pilus assembly protein PilW